MASTIDTYVYDPDDEVVSGEIDPDHVYSEYEINSKIVIPEREQSRIHEFMDQINPRQKTLVYCSTQHHAAAVRDYINQIKDIDDPHYCERVTANDGALGEQHLREFQDNERSIPTILTTSQKLSTGVDARNVRNIVLMRPVKSMIEFKQIVGRGTRTFEGKDFFTVYDFVKAYEHFKDPEWDGNPLPVEPPTETRSKTKGSGERPETKPEPEAKILIKLADGKERKIKYIATTTCFSNDGKMISAEEFMEQLFGDLGDLVRDEDHLREIWSNPETRVGFTKLLADKGYDGSRLEDMKLLIDAPNSDVFDVLAYVRFSLDPMQRSERTEQVRELGLSEIDGEMRSFLDAVLTAYEKQGVEELALTKIGDFLKVRYGGTNGAKRVLGGIPEIKQAFMDIQTHLYTI
ncbi:helicase-related protein [Amylibacter sp.]|nr:helicase-related protein [Amylibacter sp.]